MASLAHYARIASFIAASTPALFGYDANSDAQAAPQESNDQRKLIAGTRVRLAPPPGCAPGRGFLGYQWEPTASSLTVFEVPGAYSEIVAGLDAEGLAKQGMTLLDASDARFGDRQGKLLHATQSAQGFEFEKWIAVIGDESRTVTITANFPKSRSKDLSEPFKSALLGAVWDPKLEIDPFEVLTWTIAPPQGLKFAGSFGTALIFTENGRVVLKGAPSVARLSVSPSMGRSKIVDARKFTESRLKGFPSFEAVELESSTEFAASGRSGWEVVAKAADKETGAELVLHVVVLVGDDGYDIFVSQSARDQRDTWLPRFRACAASWKLKDPPEAK